MKVLLLGGNGQVGHELRRSLAPLGDLVVTTRDGLLTGGATCEVLDLADLDAIAPLVDRVQPDLVVNATAYTAVDRAESEREQAMRINAEAPRRLAEACHRAGASLVHYSTDYVFSGDATAPYGEEAPTCPVGAYGASKLAGEEAIRESGVSHLILRTAWVYGLHGNNFMRTMLRLGGEREELRVVSDQVGCPTPAWLIADVTAQLLQIRTPTPTGVLHLVSRGKTSWHGFAEAIFEVAERRRVISRPPRVLAIPTSEYPTPARRPAYSVLDTTEVVRWLRRELPDWRVALEGTFDRAQKGMSCFRLLNMPEKR
ncbi:dTDP-4-dehydrorhamnose reductase [Lysobacter korlensis]|uniref:dTDP-4-dehydrorhamnose reductase n=1 Tax=Lysobacter korlensis TaxID=553636 RepID=A0ABV6RPG1_9GAMM